MELEFDKGSPHAPKGHAIVYFRARYEPDRLFATYVVVLPLTVDFTKYVPPFLASHLSNAPLKELSTFSLPPVPEEVESHGHLLRLAELRTDDLVCGGTVSPDDLPETMEAANEALQEYSRLWAAYIGSQPTQATEADDTGLGVTEVLYSLMNEGDRLQELSKLVGKLRFAVEGEDQALIAEACEQITLVGRHLPEGYQVAGLLRAAGDSSNRGASLAQLYLDRCYRLMEGNDQRAHELEQKIRALEDSGQGSVP